MESVKIDPYYQAILCECGSNNHHIHDLYIFHGPDDYYVTDVLRVWQDPNDESKLEATHIPANVFPKHGFRLRHEPEVHMLMYCEMCEKKSKLRVGHHKGCVFIHREDD